MANQPWLDSVRERLARQALPSAYIERLTEELSDHLEELKEDGMEANPSARLGEPEQVVAAAAAAYRRRSFIGRHVTAAFAVFAISPVIVQYVMILVGTMAMVIVRGPFGLSLPEDRWMVSSVALVTSAFISILFGQLAIWLGVGKKWTIVSCVVLGVFAALIEFGVSSHAVTVMLPVQVVVPLSMGWWFTSRKWRPAPAATRFLVFALSPVALYSLLWLGGVLAYSTVQQSLDGPTRFVAEHCGTTAAIAWTLVPLLGMYVVPTVVVSLLYCKLAGRSGVGNRWMTVSCAVLAMFATAQSCASLATCMSTGQFALWGGVGLIQLLIPLGIGWWFVRHRRHAACPQVA
jgi:hypothetical protein